MSTQSAVMDRLATLLAGLDGVNPNVTQGTPEDLGLSNAVNAPNISIEFGSERGMQQTMGPDGLYQIGFVSLVRFFVGAPDTKPEQATANARALFDQVRAAVMNDEAASPDQYGNRELNGTAFEVALGQGENNLASYADRGEAPEVRIRIAVVVNTTRSAM